MTYYLDMKKIRSVLLTIVSCSVFVGDNEEDLELFKQHNGLIDLQPEDELDLMKSFPVVFETIATKARNQIT